MNPRNIILQRIKWVGHERKPVVTVGNQMG